MDLLDSSTGSSDIHRQYEQLRGTGLSISSSAPTMTSSELKFAPTNNSTTSIHSLGSSSPLGSSTRTLGTHEESGFTAVDRAHMEEMIRVHDLWQESKRALRETKREHATLLREYESEVERNEQQHKRVVKDFQGEIAVLKEEMEKTLNSLNQQVKANGNAGCTIKDLQRQLASTHEKYADQVSHNCQMAVRIRELEDNLETLRREHRVARDQAVAKQRIQIRDAERALLQLKEQKAEMASTLQQERQVVETKRQHLSKRDELVRIMDRDINNLKGTHKQQQKIIEEYAEDKQRLKTNNRAQKETIDLQEEQISELKAEVSKLTVSLKSAKEVEVAIEKQALGEFRRNRKMLEQRLEKLQNDCSQVAKLLVEDSSDDKKTPVPPTYPPHGGGTYNSLLENSANMARYEEEWPGWLPDDVAHMMAMFKTNLPRGAGAGTYGLGTSGEKHLSEFLISLNQIWKQRLETKIKALKRKHTRALADQKRKLGQQRPYDQVVNKAKVGRLENELSCSRAILMKQKGQTKQGILDLSLATVESLSRQMVEAEKTSEALRIQCQELIAEREKNIHNFECGAKWLKDRTGPSLDHLTDKVWEHVNAFVDLAIRLSRTPNFIARLSEACQDILDAIEHECTMCRSRVKDCVEEAYQAAGRMGVNANPTTNTAT